VESIEVPLDTTGRQVLDLNEDNPRRRVRLSFLPA